MGAMMMRKEPASAPRRPFEKPTGGGGSLVRPHGMLRGPCAALPDDRSMLSGGLAWLEVECARCKTREPAIRHHTSA